MTPVRKVVIALVALGVGLALWTGLNRGGASINGPQRYELLTDSPVDLDQAEDRELFTLVLQKLSAFGAVRSALKPRIAIPDFVQPTPQSTLLLLQRQKGSWAEPKGRQELLRIMDQIGQRLGGAQVRTGMITKLPFPNRVPVELKNGRCWRLKAGNSKDLNQAIKSLKSELGDRFWSVEDLPDELALEALALRMELYTKGGESALVFSDGSLSDFDVRAARVRAQAIDCGRDGVVEILPFLIEEFSTARFTSLSGKGWLSAKGDRILVVVDLPEGLEQPRWSQLIQLTPGISVHQTGGLGTVQLTPATALHDQLDFSVGPSEAMQWISSAGTLLIEVDPGLSSAQLAEVPMPQGWTMKLSQASRAHP